MAINQSPKGIKKSSVSHYFLTVTSARDNFGVRNFYGTAIQIKPLGGIKSQTLSSSSVLKKKEF